MSYSRDYVLALGAEEVARREAEKKESDRVFTAWANDALRPQGYRLANGGEPGAHFEWLRIDDREMDGGLCKVWVVQV